MDLSKLPHFQTGWLLALLLPALPWLYKQFLGKLKVWIVGLLVKSFCDALEAGDADDDALLLAFAQWVDKKSEGALSKEDRTRAVVNTLVAKFPVLAGKESALLDTIHTLLESVHDAAEEAKAKKA